jgi:V/A-type H+/Na+-transporting ATPase subunit D
MSPTEVLWVLRFPMVSLEKKEMIPAPFGLHSSNILLDQAYEKFTEAKQLTAELAEVENSVLPVG